jgi:hypothetical protein
VGDNNQTLSDGIYSYTYDAGSGAIDGDQQIAWQFQSGGTVAHRYLHGPAVDQVLGKKRKQVPFRWFRGGAAQVPTLKRTQ